MFSIVSSVRGLKRRCLSHLVSSVVRCMNARTDILVPTETINKTINLKCQLTGIFYIVYLPTNLTTKRFPASARLHWTRMLPSMSTGLRVNWRPGCRARCSDNSAT